MWNVSVGLKILLWKVTVKISPCYSQISGYSELYLLGLATHLCYFTLLAVLSLQYDMKSVQASCKISRIVIQVPILEPDLALNLTCPIPLSRSVTENNLNTMTLNKSDCRIWHTQSPLPDDGAHARAQLVNIRCQVELAEAVSWKNLSLKSSSYHCTLIHINVFRGYWLKFETLNGTSELLFRTELC